MSYRKPIDIHSDRRHCDRTRSVANRNLFYLNLRLLTNVIGCIQAASCHALAYGMVFNEMLRYTDFLKMSAFTMGVSTLDYNSTAAVYNTTGLLFKMYGDHLGSIPVALSGNSPQPAPKYPIAGDRPKINPGSPTYPLDMFAALTADHKYLTIAVVNATESEQRFDLNVTGARLAAPSTLWQNS